MKKGKRYLVIDKTGMDWTLHKEKADPVECKCLDHSPKGRVKLKWSASHYTFWTWPEKFHIVETL